MPSVWKVLETSGRSLRIFHTIRQSRSSNNVCLFGDDPNSGVSNVTFGSGWEECFVKCAMQRTFANSLFAAGSVYKTCVLYASGVSSYGIKSEKYVTSLIDVPQSLCFVLILTQFVACYHVSFLTSSTTNIQPHQTLHFGIFFVSPGATRLPRTPTLGRLFLTAGNQRFWPRSCGERSVFVRRFCLVRGEGAIRGAIRETTRRGGKRRSSGAPLRAKGAPHS